MSPDTRRRWFAQLMAAGLEEKLVAPADVLAHATPEVLANHLPAEVMTKIFEQSLAGGSLTPERLLQTLTPEVLTEHLPHQVLWSCLAAAAERAGVSAGG